MKASELRGKDGPALDKELTELLKAQFGLRMQIATQQLSNTSQLKKVRRDIARVHTLKTETSKAGNSQPATTKATKAKKAGSQ